MTIPSHTFELRKGNTRRLSFTVVDSNEDPVDLSASEIVFRAEWRGGELRLSSEDDDEFDMTGAADGEVEINLSVDQTRLFPTGKIAKYEVEKRLAGEQITLFDGYILATEWVNDDV